jgi:prophage antirepressor-like protein
MKLEKFENELLDIKLGAYINNDNEIYFRGKDVANFLGYGNTAQTISIHVDDDDKWKLEELWGIQKIDALTSNEKKTIYHNLACKIR